MNASYDPRAADCLVDACVVVETEARYRDLPPAPTDRIFAVMENGQLLGIVSERQAALFPDRIFADLLLLRQPPTVAATTSLEQTLPRLEEGPWDSLPVTNDEGTFIGVVTRLSVFRCLLQREQASRERLASTIRLLEEELTHPRMAAAGGADLHALPHRAHPSPHGGGGVRSDQRGHPGDGRPGAHPLRQPRLRGDHRLHPGRSGGQNAPRSLLRPA
jgi:hypothetical protein